SHRALPARDQVPRDRPATAARPLYRSNRGAPLPFRAVLRGQARDTVGAVKLLREAAVIRARLADDFPRSVDYPSDAGLTLDWLAVVPRGRGPVRGVGAQTQWAGR